MKRIGEAEVPELMGKIAAYDGDRRSRRRFDPVRIETCF
jgi:hypothetical protein